MVWHGMLGKELALNVKSMGQYWVGGVFTLPGV